MPREMTSDEIEDLLEQQMVGRLGMIDGSVPYVVPISYAYREGDVYAHSAQGRKLSALRARPEVCFEVDAVDALDRWRSVIAWGTYEQLLGGAAREGLDILLERFRPATGATGTEHPGAELGMARVVDIPRMNTATLGRPDSAAAVFRIRLNIFTGRAEEL
ncbi:pyridoxamine 5'-phosphate oxidase family protein [Leifsonia poae]|uniref:pyridoxamine 5'-phosphate oxidase family protein n=1 Tax=Leifsonia poae TaxID=110933 RepID=UPI003D687FE9